jgi:hypothetical protein
MRSTWDGEVTLVGFRCTFNNTHLFTFEFESETDEWDSLIEACETGGSYCLDWAPSNGSCKITVSGNNTTFVVGKYGDGNGGEITITLPTNICLPAFIQANEFSS